MTFGNRIISLLQNDYNIMLLNMFSENETKMYTSNQKEKVEISGTHLEGKRSGELNKLKARKTVAILV